MQAERRVTSEDEHQWWVGRCTALRPLRLVTGFSVSRCLSASEAAGPGRQHDEEPGHRLDIGALVLPLVPSRRGQRQSQGK